MLRDRLEPLAVLFIGEFHFLKEPSERHEEVLVDILQRFVEVFLVVIAHLRDGKKVLHLLLKVDLNLVQVLEVNLRVLIKEFAVDLHSQVVVCHHERARTCRSHHCKLTHELVEVLLISDLSLLREVVLDLLDLLVLVSRLILPKHIVRRKAHHLVRVFVELSAKRSLSLQAGRISLGSAHTRPKPGPGVRFLIFNRPGTRRIKLLCAGLGHTSEDPPPLRATARRGSPPLLPIPGSAPNDQTEYHSAQEQPEPPRHSWSRWSTSPTPCLQWWWLLLLRVPGRKGALRHPAH